MKRLLQYLAIAAFALSASVAAHADTIAVAAAADLKFCLDEIVADFQRAEPGAKVDVAYGSSGNFTTQIEQDAPFDLFFSADSEYPEKLAQAGKVRDVTVYAIGRIVLWSATRDASHLTLAELAKPDIKRIAIANPQHAPYGQRAQQALQAAGVWDAVKDKIVYGENIAQTATFAETGNADVGIIALSLARNPTLAAKGGYAEIPASLHQPLRQAFALTTRGADKPLAQRFAAYVKSPAARAVMTRYGFALPDGAATP
jgi:molybdate transport system substrate-binding protein